MKDTTTSTTLTLHEAQHNLQEIFQPTSWSQQKESSSSFSTAVQLLLEYSALASHKFQYGSTCVLPLSLLLLSKSQVTLPIVQQVHKLYPPSVNSFGLYYKYSAGVHGKLSRPDFGYYPLYLACLESCREDVIEYLAEQLEEDHYYPECLAMFRRLYQKPHLSLPTTKILLTKYPDLTTVEYSGGKVLDLALQSGYAKEILSYILEKTPHKSMTVRAPTTFKQESLELLRDFLLPQMTSLDWATHNPKGLDILRDCLQNNTSVTNLTMEIRGCDRTATSSTLQALVANNRLSSLSIESTSSCLDLLPLVETLHHNRNLHTLTLDPPLGERTELNALLKVLETHNTGLHAISIHQCLHKYSSHKKIAYYLLLNQSGRFKARNPQTPINEFLRLLEGTQQQDAMHRFRLLYGLLRETPSLWCNPQQTE